MKRLRVDHMIDHRARAVMIYSVQSRTAYTSSVSRSLLIRVLVVLAIVAAPSTGLGRSALAQADLTNGHVDVALDPGHSRWDVGATGGGLREFEVTLDLARRARSLLEANGFAVRLTRDGPERVAPQVPADATQAIRVEQEARHQAAGDTTVFVSIHLNGHPNSTLRGTETYYNRDNLGEPSYRLAAALQHETRAALGSSGYTPLDRGVSQDISAGKPYGHFFSLRGPFPSALIEVLFLSSPDEAALLHDDGIRDAIARGIADGVTAYLRVESDD